MRNQLVECPRCLRHGFVYWARVKATGRLILLCNLCEATWLEHGDIGFAEPQELRGYLDSVGLSPDVEEVNVLMRAMRVEGFENL
jgi:hypothetical protein